jgi:macrodomain Ter protein organizer (MatP/YcbG family)
MKRAKTIQTDENILAHVSKYQKIEARQARKRKIRELEQEVSRTHVGSVELDNDLKVRADMFSDPDTWTLHVNIQYKVNNRKRNLKAAVDMNDVKDSTTVTDMIRHYVLEDLSKAITAEAVSQNKTPISAASKEFMG